MSNKCILVAEDDSAIRRVLADSLTGAGYDVRTAPDGRAALELLLSTPVDLALLDVNMPEISGFKLLRMMQKECP
ncbi:MAG: response regulator, partial [Akkermansia sp.]|nr:response regulator [Akkermansia sp.]